MHNNFVKKISDYILLIIFGLFALIQVYPLIWLIFTSFKDNLQIFGGNVLGLPSPWMWQNYKQSIVDGNVGSYFINSVIVTAVVIVISGVIAAMAAYAISRMQWKYNKAALIYFLLGLMIPIHAALLPLFFILKSLKLLNSYFSLIIPYLAFSLPMAILIISSFMQALPKELEESACIDGCSVYKAFAFIILPLVRPALATVSIFTYLASWNELMFAVTFISKKQFKTLTVGIMSLASEYVTDWGPIVAGLVVATVPTLAIYMFMSEQVQKSLTEGAVKG